MPSGPDLKASVIVIGYAPADLLERCLTQLLSQQTGRSDTEILVVAHPSDQGSPLSPVRSKFPQVNWVDAPATHNVARMRGLGIARSRAPIVAFLEGDCMPAPDWLERLAASAPATAVGGAVEPGGFTRAIDWAAYFCEFGKFMQPLPAVLPQLPGANVAYRRSALPDASRLEAEGFYETFVNAAVAERGGALAGDTNFVVFHERRWSRRAALATRYHHGRGFGALRTRGMPATKRLPYIAIALALPALLVGRVLGESLRRRRFVGATLRASPWIVALSLSWALGELAGYAAGPGTSLEQWR